MINIALDVDGVIADMASAMVTVYNYHSIEKTSNFQGISEILSVDQINDYDLEKIIGKSAFKSLINIMIEKKMCKYLPMYAGAFKLVKELRDIGNVFFVTKPFECYEDWCKERKRWLVDKFSANPDNIVFMSKKYLFNADIIIEDSVENINEWMDNRLEPAIKIKRPWNMFFSREGLHIVNALEEVPNKIREICLEGKNM